MSQELQIHPLQTNSQSIVVGENALEYLERLTISDEGKQIICNEASDILSHCIPAGKVGCITNLAVGYVQSGKTMSFTALTALAADNGYKIIIYLTGTKTNLQNQTSSRLSNDLGIADSSVMRYRLIEDFDDTRSFRMILNYPGATLLVPILKHYKHINDLAALFEDANTKSALGNKGILIIDDEADQASLNTYAHRNARLEDWEADEQSQTYKSIIRLKKALPNHSYVQYTATPQSLLLIDTDDILSPKFHTVLTPGNGYTGGKYFFKEKQRKHIRIIPDEEVETSRNPLQECPPQLIMALRQFVLSIAYKVLIREDEKYLSMMVHIDGTRDANIKYKTWIDEVLETWFYLAQDSLNVGLLKAEFRPAYEDLASTIEDCPSLDELFEQLLQVLLQTKTYLVHSGLQNRTDTEINWSAFKAHILVGANMLNRGFTVEHLSITFMPRTTASTATADTIEQRCRFFGYKAKYADVCRIYISEKARQEFTDYVDHEEILRAALLDCPNHTLTEYKDIAKQLIISNHLKPTRTNVLSKDYVRHQMNGWKQFRTVDFLTNNLQLFNQFVAAYEGDFSYCNNFDQDARNHRFVDLSIDAAIMWLSHFQFYDMELRDRRSSTIQYLRFIQSEHLDYPVRFYQMAYKTTRKRKLESVGDSIKPINLQMGHSRDNVYPGDAAFKSEEFITVQLHHIRIEDDQLRMEFNNKETCNLAIYYPDGLSFSYLEF